MAFTYDASRQPDPELWEALDESQRVRAVVEHHRTLKAAHAHLPSPQAHAAMHVVVENQLAEDEPLTVRVTLRRLMDDGLNRHEAVHAIGTVASRRLLEVLRHGSKWDNDAYVRELNALTREGVIGTVRVQH